MRTILALHSEKFPSPPFHAWLETESGDSTEATDFPMWHLCLSDFYATFVGCGRGRHFSTNCGFASDFIARVWCEVKTATNYVKTKTSRGLNKWHLVVGEETYFHFWHLCQTLKQLSSVAVSILVIVVLHEILSHFLLLVDQELHGLKFFPEWFKFITLFEFAIMLCYK